ncbi:MAG TPA: hypothetical protein VM433_08370 [Mycobacteriales bacterium]|nr:hypothetical protein [Mycobacteriales bacterium]
MQPDPRPGEEDVDRDDHEALSRATGGVPDEDAPDQHSSTGTTPNDEMVGRVGGQDVGYAGQTGAERRAEWEKEQSGD